MNNEGVLEPQYLISGQLRDTEDGVIDIVMNNRLLSAFNSTKTAFLHPVLTTQWRYVIRKEPQPESHLHFHLLQQFGSCTKLLYGITSVAFVGFWYFLGKIQRKMRRNSRGREDFQKICLMLLGIESSISVSLKKTIPAYQKILLTSILIFSLIMCNGFQGTIVSHLTHPTHAAEVKTLKRLLEGDFNLTVFSVQSAFFKPNDNSSNVNEIQTQLYARQTVGPVLTVEKFEEILKEPKQAVLSTKSRFLSNLSQLFFIF